MFQRCYAVSEGTINDFTEHSPAAALYEGHLFAVLELLYYVNKLPDAAGQTILKSAGVQKILGTKAQVTLTFSLSAPLGNSFTLSAGYKVKTKTGLRFVTDSLLTIPPGQTQGDITATAEFIGSQYNVAAYSIVQLTETRAFLAGVTNKQPSAGGRNEETDQETLARGFVALRRRDSLVSATDFEDYARNFLGPGSAALCIGLLAADKESYQNGTCHVFCLNPDRTQPNQAQLNTLLAQMTALSPAGLEQISVSAIETFDLQLHVVAVLVPGSDPLKVAQRIYARLDTYFTPGDLAIGETILIKEVELVVRNAGVQTVQSVGFITGNADNLRTHYNNLQLPNRWTAAVLYDCTVQLVDLTTKATYTHSFGNGGDPD